MRIVKRYNEAWYSGIEKDTDEFYDYIKSCFISMIERAEGYGLTDEENFETLDDGFNLMIDLRSPSETTKIASINPPFNKERSENVIKSLIDYNNYINNVYEEVLSCLTLVKQKYPNCMYEIETGEYELDIVNSNVNIHYMYYISILFKLNPTQ